MKKIALTSLLAVFAVSGAHAANVIDGNPLYMPGAKHFYSVTGVESQTRNVDAVALNEEFGFGVTDRLAVAVETGFAEEDWFTDHSWDNLGLKAAFRALDMGAWKMDLVGGYAFDNLYNHPRPEPQDAWFDEDLTMYTWTAGVRGGYTTGDFTLAGHLMMEYSNIESFNWGEEDAASHKLLAGIDAQVLLSKSLNLVAGAEYSTTYEDYSKKIGSWDLSLGANYNIDATKYIGAYMAKEINHTQKFTKGTWEVADGFRFGAKFGIDF